MVAVFRALSAHAKEEVWFPVAASLFFVFLTPNSSFVKMFRRFSIPPCDQYGHSKINNQFDCLSI